MQCDWLHTLGFPHKSRSFKSLTALFWQANHKTENKYGISLFLAEVFVNNSRKTQDSSAQAVN